MKKKCFRCADTNQKSNLFNNVDNHNHRLTMDKNFATAVATVTTTATNCSRSCEATAATKSVEASQSCKARESGPDWLGPPDRTGPNWIAATTASVDAAIVDAAAATASVGAAPATTKGAATTLSKLLPLLLPLPKLLLPPPSLKPLPWPPSMSTPLPYRLVIGLLNSV
jgi:hypothetical protein